jgi:hypothetical protein
MGQKERAAELAKRIDAADHMVLMDSPADYDDDMIETTICADDHNLIAEALRAFAATNS